MAHVATARTPHAPPHAPQVPPGQIPLGTHWRSVPLVKSSVMKLTV